MTPVPLPLEDLYATSFSTYPTGTGLRHENEKRGTTLPNVIYNNNANATARQEEVEIAAPTTPICGNPNLPKIKA